MIINDDFNVEKQFIIIGTASIYFAYWHIHSGWCSSTVYLE